MDYFTVENRSLGSIRRNVLIGAGFNSNQRP